MRTVIVCVIVGLSCGALCACSSSETSGAGANATDTPSVTPPSDAGPSASGDTDAPATDIAVEADGLPTTDTAPAPDIAVASDGVDAPDISTTVDVSQTSDAAPTVDSATDTSTPDQLAPATDTAVDVAAAEVGPEVAVEPDTDEQGVPDGVTTAPEDLWLFSVHTPTKTLLKVDVQTGAAEAWCTLPDSTTNYPSLTFDRNNQLLASRAAKPWGLDLIDPCTCAVSPIGQYGNFTEVNGITASHGFDLFGIASAGNQLISISSQTGAAAAVGVLAVDFTTGGTTWSDEVSALYAINGGDDTLYTLDPDTADTLATMPLDHNFGTVGMERHPLNGVLYGCSTAGDLLEVDPETGDVVVIGPMGWEGACTNLAAPFQPVECVDGV